MHIQDILPATTATAQGTVKKMREVFVIHGLPNQIVRQRHTFHCYGVSTIHGTNGVQHIRVTPYHPSSKGLAEWTVQSFKDSMKKLSATPANVETKIRITIPVLIPHNFSCINGIAPAELLMQ